MIIRNDVRPSSTVIPKELTESILRVGGTNIHGEPLFRLILAENRVSQAAGEWSTWADSVAIEDRGGVGTAIIQKMLSQYHGVMEAAVLSGMAQHELEKLNFNLSNAIEEVMRSKLAEAPLRVERGMADVGLYPFEGFILEKWKPAESFGSRDDWESYRFDGMCALGPYPAYGDYELCAGPTPYMPTAAQLEDAIRQDFRNIQNRPRSAKERVCLMMQKVEQAQKAKAREQANKAESFRKETGTIMNRISLGAGRVRNELAKKAGITEHCGN